MTIRDTCLSIARVCKEYGDLSWTRSFERFAEGVEHGEWDAEKRKIISVFAGMGSFNDLALGNELDTLRSKLYKEVIDNW